MLLCLVIVFLKFCDFSLVFRINHIIRLRRSIIIVRVIYFRPEWLANITTLLWSVNCRFTESTEGIFLSILQLLLQLLRLKSISLWLLLLRRLGWERVEIEVITRLFLIFRTSFVIFCFTLFDWLTFFVIKCKWQFRWKQPILEFQSWLL